MSIFDRLFAAKAQKNAYGEIEVEFYKRANAHIPHGQLIVSHKGYNLTQVPVNFVFPGLTEAPPLTKRLVNDLWSAAESQGYFPHAIASYGTAVMPEVVRDPDWEGDQPNTLQDVDLSRTPELQKHLSSKHLETSPASSYSQSSDDPLNRTVERMVDLATGRPLPEFLRKQVEDGTAKVFDTRPSVGGNPGTSAPNDPFVQGGQIRFPDAPTPSWQPTQAVEDLVGYMIDQIQTGEGEFDRNERDAFLTMPDDIQELVAIKAAQKWNNVWQTQKNWTAGEQAAISVIHYTLGDWRAAGEAMVAYMKDKYPNVADVMAKEENNDKVKEMTRIFFRAPKNEGLNSVDEMLLGTLYRMAEEGKPFPPADESDSKAN